MQPVVWPYGVVMVTVIEATAGVSGLPDKMKAGE